MTQNSTFKNALSNYWNRLILCCALAFGLLITANKVHGQIKPTAVRLAGMVSDSAIQASPLTVSLLTCSPGADLYSSFGHTAIRVQDRLLHTDFVFNYGTFQFDQPNFYLKFTRGKLEFMLSISTFEEFMYEYKVTQRSVTEQVLNLSNEQKDAILGFLKNNYLPQNRYYKYDFLYDNCATRIRDILFGLVKDTKINGQIVPDQTSFRDLIYHYLDKGGQPWSKLGIDILLGSRIDIPVDNNTAMFLPDYLSRGVDCATVVNKPYVLSEKKIIDLPAAISPSGKYLPLVVVSIFTLLLLTLYYLGKNWPKLHLILDSLLLYITGLLGILLLFMWFGTDHQACKNNYNLLWAMPFNLVAGFFIYKPRKWLQKYFMILLIITALLLGFWWGLPQHFNIAILPFCILMLIRYGALASRKIIKKDSL
ncbi:protein of unknown function [Arachidicoccus rhizosphaerae]|uniref:Uncharacterized protein n=1 Tax=Arachidicoccus rhizosphaerae TaxID=551991 RepID=A0A1H3YHI1_9BACT|nr:DUF4105 domain-containing protein [Arachidicoccus rhizosphaerae]SEA11007.1 protein of unknown function [Arachidicoccus rhizosphaerae]